MLIYKKFSPKFFYLVISLLLIITFLTIFKIDNIRQEKFKKINQKKQKLGQLLQITGYGGAIHNFKNYVIRQDKIYYEPAKKSFHYAQIISKEYIERNELIPLEIQSLENFQKTIQTYIQKLEAAKKLISSNKNISAEALDMLVKVNDTNAISGINDLINILNEDSNRLSKEDKKFQLLIFSTLISTILLLFFIVKKAIEKLNINNLDIINQKKEIEDKSLELERANEELSQFSYRASHDLKSPLTAIKVLSGLVQEDIKNDDTDEAIKNCGKISKKAIRLEELVIDILNLTKSDLEDEDNSDINIEQLFSSIKDNLSWLSEEHQVQMPLDAKVKSFKSQKTRLQQLLENLLSNGIKYHNFDATDRFVKVSVETKNDKIKIEVADNGSGIPEKYIDKIFDLFQRFHPKHSPGSGIGLAIVKKHIDRLNGTIDVTSSKTGTTFTILIPNLNE